ncbi:MAG: NYN domain-containing protein [Candidatus Uhrbacteria bacterium]
MKTVEKNFAFIDSQNLILGIKSLGWKLNFRKFRRYLKEKYSVDNAYMFIGYIPDNTRLYTSLQESGFILNFKPVLDYKNLEIVKGNIDADLVLLAMLEYKNYDKAVIVSSDGDFYSLVEHLYKENKLKAVLSPHIKTCSQLLKRSGKDKIRFMDNLRNKLEYIKNEKAPL